MNYNKQFNPYGTAFSILFEHEWFELAFDPHYCKIRGDLNFNFDYYEISRNNREGMYKNNFITPPLIAVEENELPHGKIIFDLFSERTPISLSAYIEILSGAHLPKEEILSEKNLDKTKNNFMKIFSELNSKDFEKFYKTNMFLNLDKNYAHHKNYFQSIIKGFQKEIPLREAKNTEMYDNRLKNISLREYVLDHYQKQFK